MCKFLGFGLPPTPPSSLSSDDSEDNQSAEIHTIPSSPASSLSSFSPNSSQAQLAHQQSATSKNGQCSNGSPNSSRGYSTSSSRQPIHTPLISNQPVCWSLPFFVVTKRLIDRSIHLFIFHLLTNHTHSWELINLCWYVTIMILPFMTYRKGQLAN